MAVVSFETKDVKAREAKTRNVRGGGTVDVPAMPAYTYQIAKATAIDGDETGENTFLETFNTLAKGNYKNATKFLVKGFNFYSKKNSAPKTDAKQLKALRTLAEATGKSVDQLKAELGL